MRNQTGIEYFGLVHHPRGRNDDQGRYGSPNGIFLVTGPTGSGKSTMLYSIMNFLNKPDINIMTIEDPVEYRIVFFLKKKAGLK